MMVERSSKVEIFQELDRAAQTLSSLSKKKEAISQKDVNGLTQFIKKFNELGPKFWSDKTITQAEKNTIQKAINALHIFQQAQQPARKDVDQIIVALFNDIKLFDEKLKNLNERTGIKVEKPSASKEY